MLAGTADLAAVETELRELELAMAGGAHDPKTMALYSAAQARLEHAGGYDWRDRATSVVRGLGFTTDDLDRPLTTFSGGELTRASLARALASQPDLLLLDEPTNHLDIESIEWLEDLLKTLDAAVILVAHDRWFLEAVTTAVLELDRGRSVFFPGQWHVWRREQAARALHAEKEAARQGEDIARLERFVERFGAKNTKAKQAKAKQKQIDRIKAQQVEAGPGPRRTLGFEFLKPARTGRIVLDAEGLDIRAGEKELLHDGSVSLERGEHVALVGPNGAGKTTLIETILGRREPAAGKVRFGHGVEPAYFSQHEAELDERGSVLEATMSATGLRRPEAQSLLGRFLFSGWEAHEKPVSVLSGGERRRLALAQVVASGANLLVLDEPTNHLDVESREALEAALEAFPGTVLLITHDRALLDAVSGRVLALEDRRLVSYAGGWSEYRRRDEEAEAPAEPSPKPKVGKPKPPRPARRSRRRRRRSSSSSARSRAARSGSPSSSASWPRTGRTSTWSRHTVAPATTSSGCSPAGSRCSRRPRPSSLTLSRRRSPRPARRDGCPRRSRSPRLRALRARRRRAAPPSEGHAAVAVRVHVDERIRVPADRSAADQGVREPRGRIREPRDRDPERQPHARRVDQPVDREHDRDQRVHHRVHPCDVRVERLLET